MQKTLSLIIPTRNSAGRLHALLEAAQGQTLRPDETIVIDSSSKDGTQDMARSLGAKVVVIPRADFDHGGTRTIAGKKARGEILLYMTDDAVPASMDCFAKLLAGFANDGTAAVYGRQLPNQNASLISQHLRLFNYPAQSYLRRWTDCRQYGVRTSFLSNSFCAYRRADLEGIGWFREDIICIEDACAAYELLKRGRIIGYQAEACVYHSHNYSPWQEFARYFDTGVMHACEKKMFDDLGHAEGEGLRYLLSAFGYFGARVWIYPEFFVRAIMKYGGYRLGKAHRLLPAGFRIRLSMNKNWWTRTRLPVGLPASQSHSGPN